MPAKLVAKLLKDSNREVGRLHLVIIRGQSRVEPRLHDLRAECASTPWPPVAVAVADLEPNARPGGAARPGVSNHAHPWQDAHDPGNPLA